MIDLPIVVLCGGLGTRLRPAVADRPKALAAVGDKPFLSLVIEHAKARGARRFVLCVGHMADQIEAAFGDGSALGVRIDYSRDGDTLLGTGGALKRAAAHFAPAAVVVNGDTHLDLDLGKLIRTHAAARARGAVATLTLAHAPDAGRFGAVELRGNRVAGFREKGLSGPGWVNAGAYVIERELIDRIPGDTAVSLERDVFPAALADGLRVAAMPHERPFADIGTPEDYRAFVARREAAGVA
jgi:NDP-sugar pyrophosphorylase family protein